MLLQNYTYDHNNGRALQGFLPPYQIQNGRLSAVINFTMPDIWQTVPDSWTIRPTIKQIMPYQKAMC